MPIGAERSYMQACVVQFLIFIHSSCCFGCFSMFVVVLQLISLVVMAWLTLNDIANIIQKNPFVKYFD